MILQIGKRTLQRQAIAVYINAGNCLLQLLSLALPLRQRHHQHSGRIILSAHCFQMLIAHDLVLGRIQSHSHRILLKIARYCLMVSGKFRHPLQGSQIWLTSPLTVQYGQLLYPSQSLRLRHITSHSTRGRLGYSQQYLILWWLLPPNSQMSLPRCHAKPLLQQILIDL